MLEQVPPDRKVARRMRTTWRDVFHSREQDWRAGAQNKHERFSAEADAIITNQIVNKTSRFRKAGSAVAAGVIMGR
eukprot:COSAG05_NODE_3952_length_1754_cov_1.475529_2_plen_76_part_00